MPNSKPPFSERFFKMLVRVFPFDFQTNYGGEMAGVFREQEREAEARGGVGGVLRLWTETIAGVFRTAPREHWEILKQDCAYAFRMMRQNRGFTLIAVLTLALGIGANTAIFSVVHAVLLSPLPYRQGQQLVFVRQQAQKMGVNDIGFSVPEILDYRDQNRTFSSLVEYHTMSFTLFGHGDPARVRTGVVSWNYFEMFGIKPILGRTFLPPDDQIGAPPVLLLSYEYWKGDFHGDPGIVGKTFEMNDKVHTVIGVLPPVPQYPNENDVYMPTSACPFRSSQRMIEGRDHRMMEVFGRLKPGVSLAQADADLATIASRLESSYSKTYPPEAGYGVAASSLRDELTQGARPTLIVLLAAAGFVLLIACANVANLTLSRMARRERELAVRTALGAGRSRLLRQLLTESFVLAFIGGAAGLLLAYDSLGLLADFAARLTPRAREIHVDTGVLLFTLAAAVGVSVIFGTLSAVSARGSLASGLKEGSAGAGAGRQRTLVRSVLIVAQIAFSFILLIGAGLMLRSLYQMLQVNPGFVPQRVLAMRLTFNWSKNKTGEEIALEAKQLLDRAKGEPDVLSAAVSSTYPLEPELLTFGQSTTNFQIEGHPLASGDAPPLANVASASPDYFKTLGIPLLRGRLFADTDDQKSLQVVVINDAMRRRYWPNEDPIGKRLSPNDGKDWLTIVGVVGDVRELGVDQTPGVEVYSPVAQSADARTLLVRTMVDPWILANRLSRAVHEVDPQIAISHVMSVEDARHESLAAPRLTASLLGLFAGLALLIAVAGIGGVMALSVSQRVREIGIRMALGAQPSGIVRMFLGQGLGLALLGVGIGFAGALALTRLLKSLLFEVTPTDPATFIGVALVLIIAALVACFVPARRAASIDPNVALRCE
ncbi:MAG TPA: ABC transporter permease [Candidatus Acidoferrum sp.]|nr:ABC transporter permease [Candidatus Acidoferrum sp.]